MKIRLLTFIIGLGLLTLASCTNGDILGIGMGPDDDRASVKTDTFLIKASTIKVDSVYAKTSEAALGEIYDPLYGTLKADYLCEFYCPEDFTFPSTPIDGKIDSVEFNIVYSSWTGDSLVSMQARIYEITTPLDRNYYTNINPGDYSDMQKPLGSQVYTAYDMSISDSIRNIQDMDDDNYYTPHVRIRMPLEFGQKIYDATINNREVFKNQQTFNEFFPGLYVTTDYGIGNVLHVAGSQMRIWYTENYVDKDVNGNDSIYPRRTSCIFLTTKEVIQLNRVQNSQLDQLLTPNEDYTYLKSPAGVFTQLEIPMAEISPKIKDRRVNNFALTLRATPEEDWDYALDPPSYVLLIPKDSMSSFFENNKTIDEITTYYTSYTGVYKKNNYGQLTNEQYDDDEKRTYQFANLAKLLNYQLQYAPDENLILYVVPVTIQRNDDYTSSTGYSTKAYHEMKMSGATLRKKPEDLEIEIITSKF
ncbi:MAG: DUF4270 domain-containing protein [Tannerellaceae bacterium]|nr:DUF4270 domain-containing protein [Tannerellaceae bacterium]